MFRPAVNLGFNPRGLNMAFHIFHDVLHKSLTLPFFLTNAAFLQAPGGISRLQDAGPPNVSHLVAICAGVPPWRRTARRPPPRISRRSSHRIRPRISRRTSRRIRPRISHRTSRRIRQANRAVTRERMPKRTWRRTKARSLSSMRPP